MWLQVHAGQYIGYSPEGPSTPTSSPILACPVALSTMFTRERCSQKRCRSPLSSSIFRRSSDGSRICRAYTRGSVTGAPSQPVQDSLRDAVCLHYYQGMLSCFAKCAAVTKCACTPGHYPLASTPASNHSAQPAQAGAAGRCPGHAQGGTPHSHTSCTVCHPPSAIQSHP